MPLIILDPRTGSRITLTLPAKPRIDQRARRQVLREIDRMADYPRPAAERSS